MELEEVTPASQSEKLPPGEQRAMWYGLFGASFGEATSATKKGPWNELETGTQCMSLGAANKKNRVPCCQMRVKHLEYVVGHYERWVRDLKTQLGEREPFSSNSNFPLDP